MQRLTYGLATLLALGATQVIGLPFGSPSSRTFAQEPGHHAGPHAGQRPATGPHGGTVQVVNGSHVETILQEKGIMFSVLSPDGSPMDVSAGSGTLTLQISDSPKQYDYALKPLKNGTLGVGVDLSKVKSHKLHLQVQLTGVASATIAFESEGEVASETPSDELLLSLQGTCPVSGQKLGSMGKPPKVELGDKSLFVCCAGCIDKLKASPQQYLSKYYQTPGKELRPGVFEATLADANAIAKQKVCPVMDEPLGGMGAPGKVNVNGKAVFICCAGCAKKLAAEPDKYLAALAEQGVTPPAFK